MMTIATGRPKSRVFAAASMILLDPACRRRFSRWHPTEPCAKHKSRTYVGAGESLRAITDIFGDRSRPGVRAVTLPLGR